MTTRGSYVHKLINGKILEGIPEILFFGANLSKRCNTDGRSEDCVEKYQNHIWSNLTIAS